MILKNIRYLVTQNSNREIYEKIDLLIEDGEISGLGRNIPSGDHRLIDCSDKVVMPGLINAHTHASMTLLRGISDNKELQAWLEEDIFPAEDKLSDEDCFIGAVLGCVEMLKSGTTTFNDMYDHMDQVAEAVDRTGMRAMLGRGLLDIDGKGSERMEESVELVRNLETHDRIHTSFAPHAVYTATEQLLLEAKDCAEIFDVPYHIHVSETEQEKLDSMEENDDSPLAYLDELGLVNDNLIAAHGVWLTEQEKIILEKKGGNIIHNPSANLKLGSGIAEVPELLDREINVALGTDGVASNNNLNLFEEAKIASILHKRKSPEDIDEQQVLDMITINGAKALGLKDEIGSVEIGKKADLITINLDNPEMRPIHGKRGLISNLIYSFSGNVDDVLVEGKEVIRDGEFGNIDGEKLMQEADSKSSKF